MVGQLWQFSLFSTMWWTLWKWSPGNRGCSCCFPEVLSIVCCLGEKALSMGDHYNWRVKPKLHLLAELTQVTVKTSGAPQLFCTCLDEGWNAWLVQAARPRGGRNVPTTIALQLLQRFRAYMDKLMSPNLCAFLSPLGPA